jgi:hypothetical protein
MSGGAALPSRGRTKRPSTARARLFPRDQEIDACGHLTITGRRSAHRNRVCGREKEDVIVDARGGYFPLRLRDGQVDSWCHASRRLTSLLCWRVVRSQRRECATWAHGQVSFGHSTLRTSVFVRGGRWDPKPVDRDEHAPSDALDTWTPESPRLLAGLRVPRRRQHSRSQLRCRTM